MEFVLNIILNLLGDSVAKQAGGVTSWLKTYLWDVWQKTPEVTISEQLAQVGLCTDDAIRKVVMEYTADKAMTPQQREELTSLLINLAHSARVLTTQALGRSSFVRTVGMIEQILERLQTQRKAGESVTDGSDWTLEQFLGKGSFGEVWLGSNADYPMPRAFKFFTETEGVHAFRREQQTLSHVLVYLRDHPNIVRFENVATSANPFPYIELEFVAGGNLETWILAHREDRLVIDKHRIMEDIVRGVSKAHSHHIYHRDLKPANILLTKDPGDVAAKIGDFGLGRVQLAQNTSVSASMLRSHMLAGTPAYLPPEASQPFKQRVDAQDDVFAIGVIWYQLLVEELERPPYDFAEKLRGRGVDSATLRLITRCLAHPDRRYPDATVLEQELERIDYFEWEVPQGCYEVSQFVREYLANHPA